MPRPPEELSSRYGEARTRLFVMKIAEFVEFILQIRGAYLFLHTIKIRFASMRTEIRTSRPKQTLRKDSYTGIPTAGKRAGYAPAQRAMPFAIDATETIHH